MNVIDALSARHSVRGFLPHLVDKESLVKIFDSANRAPSWADVQPWQLFVAAGDRLERLRQGFRRRYEEKAAETMDVSRPQDWPPALLSRMQENYARRFAELGIDRDDQTAREANIRRGYEFWGAPVVAYLCLPQEVGLWSYFDLGLMAQSIMLAAQDMGIGSIPAINLVAYADLIHVELGIPKTLKVVIGIALGYEDAADPGNQFRSLRRPLDQVVQFAGI